MMMMVMTTEKEKEKRMTMTTKRTPYDQRRFVSICSMSFLFLFFTPPSFHDDSDV